MCYHKDSLSFSVKIFSLFGQGQGRWGGVGWISNGFHLLKKLQKSPSSFKLKKKDRKLILWFKVATQNGQSIIMYRANRINILYYHRKAQHGDMLIKDTDCNYSTSVNYERAPRWKEKRQCSWRDQGKVVERGGLQNET